MDESCPVCATAEIVCGKWTILVIRDLAEGHSRFCELERSLEGISPRTLSLRLRALEEEGIVERTTDPQLRDVLEALVGEAAELLRADVEAGVEVPFDLAEEEGDGAVLYQYRPLTERYIAERWARLRELPAWAPASEALGGE